MRSKKRVIFFSGPPLSGKDTQARLLAKKIKGKFLISHVVIDNFFKKEKVKYIKIGKRNFDIQKEFTKRFKGGFYSPELVGYIISKKIKELIDKFDLVFSGSPRLITEAKIEIKTLKELFVEFKVISLKIPQKEIFKRALKRRREKEDEFSVVQERIKNYRKYVIPTLNFLKKRGYLIEINGNQPVKKVYEDILKKLYSFLKN